MRQILSSVCFDKQLKIGQYNNSYKTPHGCFSDSHCNVHIQH